MPKAKPSLWLDSPEMSKPVLTLATEYTVGQLQKENFALRIRVAELEAEIAEFRNYQSALNKVTLIQRFIASKFDLDMFLILTRARGIAVDWPRQISVYLAREFTGFGPRRLSLYFLRNPSGITHCLKAAQNRLDTDPAARAQVDALRIELRDYLQIRMKEQNP